MNGLPRQDLSREHDHGDCIDSAIETAERLCRDRGLRFTATRRRVLTLVWGSHKPVGAYEILRGLAEQGQSAAPPTVYRALDFLIEAGLVHRLDSLNAFVGCPDPDRRHTGQFLICRNCRSVIELADPEIEALVAAKAGGRGFSVARQVLEIDGLCDGCRKAEQRA